MRNLKKVLSLVLCLAMMLSIMVVGAGAAFDDQGKIENAEAVEMCTALGIIDGFEDGNYHPEKNITRAQAAKLICVMLNGGKDAVKDNANSTFTDVLTDSTSAWANKYIEFCSAEGIVAGVGGNRFAPASNVTGTQLAKMLLVALGYNAAKEGFTGDSWALNVNTKAVKAGLYKGLEDVDMSVALSRDDAAQMIWNALNADTVVYWTSTVGALTYGEPLLQSVFNAYVVSGINKGTSAYNFDTQVYTYKIGDQKLPSTENYADLYAMNVNVLVRDGEIIAMTVAKGSVVFEGSLGDLVAEAVPGGMLQSMSTNDRDVLNAILEGNLNADNNASGGITLKVGAFNQYSKTNDKLDIDPMCYYGVRAIDQDGGGDIDYVVIYPYSVLKVTDVDTNKVSVRALTDNDGKCIAYDSDPCDLGRVYATKASIAQGVVGMPYAQVTGDLERYGYAIGVPAANTLENLTALIDLDAKTGKIASLDSYDYNVTFAGDATYTADQLDIEDFQSLSVKYEYTYVAVNGHLFLVNGAGVQAQAQYAVVTANSANTTGTTAKVWQTELLLPDGTTKTVESNQKRVVGRMFTYDVDNNGVYVMNPVDDASLNADNCIYDIQDVESNTLNVKNTAADLTVAKDKVGVYVGGTEGKYYVTDDTVVYAYYVEDDSYAVISAADLKDNLDDVTGAAVAAANKVSNGFYEAQIIYVALPHDVNEVVQTIYIDGQTARVAQDENGDFYVVVKAMLPGGELKEIESKHFDLKENAKLLKELYNKTSVDKVYDVSMLDGKIVHLDREVDLTPVEVTATYDTYNGKGAFTAGGVTYVVTDDTLIFSLDGKPLSAITEGDTVRILAGKTDEHGTAELDVLVYAD